jgi:hypothetical protein
MAGNSAKITAFTRPDAAGTKDAPLTSMQEWPEAACSEMVRDSPLAGARQGMSGALRVNMREAVSQSLFSYWNALRGKRLAPKRFEIEPSRIANNLPDTFILERINPTTVRFRLAGTRITDALGTELRGKNLFDLFDAEDGATLQNQMAVIAERCAVGLFRMSARDIEGRTTKFEIMVLPLTHTADTVERFLGSIVSIDKPGWLGTSPLTDRKLIDHKLIWPDGTPTAADAPSKYPVPILHSRREARIVRSDRRQFRVYDGGLSLVTEDR